MSRLGNIWPHLRAALVLCHLAAIFLLALPGAGRVGSKAQWQRPKQQAEFRQWAARLGVDKEELESFLWNLSRSYLETRKSIIRPLARYADYTGTRQGWSMFATPRRSTGYFAISIWAEGEWRLVFQNRHPEADWMQWQLEHNRIRKLIGRLITRPQQPAYREFAHWIGRRLAEDFPDATRGRIELFTWDIPEPANVRAGKARDVRRVMHRVVDLEPFR